MKKYQVIILAGLGSRMGRHTYDIPKTILKVNNKPLIKIILSTIENFCSEILIVIGHRGHK